MNKKQQQNIVPPFHPFFRPTGFTLIELLVVVLIVGVLAAVALPMYTKTVRKARLTEEIAILKMVHDSAQRKILETANVPQTYEEFDIHFPPKKGRRIAFWGTPTQATISLTYGKNPNTRRYDIVSTTKGSQLQMVNSAYQPDSYHLIRCSADNSFLCGANTDSDVKICQTLLGGVEIDRSQAPCPVSRARAFKLPN